VAALARDPKVLKRSGHLFSSWELAREYKFTDADGSRPDWGATKIDFSRHPPQLLALMRTRSEIQIEWLTELARRTKQFMKQLPAPGGPRSKAPVRKKTKAPIRKKKIAANL